MVFGNLLFLPLGSKASEYFAAVFRRISQRQVCTSSWSCSETLREFGKPTQTKVLWHGADKVLAGTLHPGTGRVLLGVRDIPLWSLYMYDKNPPNPILIIKAPIQVCCSGGPGPTTTALSQTKSLKPELAATEVRPKT